MDTMIMLGQLLLSLSFLVAVHELGHLIAAKYFGMRVEQFSIGFPPKLWSFRKGETEYALSAIPLGGYVKISGMIDESLDTEAMKKEPQPWEFRSKPAWQRLVVMLGGIMVNLIVGILIFIGMTWVLGETLHRQDVINRMGGVAVGPVGESIGIRTGDKIVKINGRDFEYFEDISKLDVLLSGGFYTVERDGQLVDITIPPDFVQSFNQAESAMNFVSIRFPARIGSVKEGTLADQLGLQPGDQFTLLNGEPVYYYDEVVSKLRKSTGSEVTLTVQRGGESLSLAGSFPTGERIIGFYAEAPKDYLKEARHVLSYSVFESVPIGFTKAFSTLAGQVTAFGKMISGVLSPQKSLSGPIGIMQAFGNTWDWERFWTLTGILSLVLAFMNLLPIPALDGGHVMFLSWEIVTRRKPSDRFLEMAQKVGMAFLLLLMVFVFANDIIKLWPN
jgi:regulator of sigma E protease